MVRQHVLRRHKQEEEVKHIEDEKDEQKRKERLHRLRCKSYHQKNLGALQARKGEIILERRPDQSHKTFDVNQYGPCPSCYAWVSKKLMKRHYNKCAQQTSLKGSALITVSETMSVRISTTVTSRMKDECIIDGGFGLVKKSYRK